jgi:hypothetical protein
MRETRLSGSEGGGAYSALPTPIQARKCFCLVHNRPGNVRYRLLQIGFPVGEAVRFCFLLRTGA